MTKERKAAIEQWETVKNDLATFGIFKKPVAEYNWQCNCWFCHYVRDHSAPGYDNGCTKCPLWKWAKAYFPGGISETDCGCSHAYWYTTLYHKVADESERLEERLKACDLIIAALKGEHIWE